jgi:TonB family protein
MKRRPVLRFSAATAWIGSTIVHASALAGLGVVPREHAMARPPATVDFRIVAPPPTVAQASAAAEKSPAARAADEEPRSPATTHARRTAQVVSPAEPLDLTGFTLTSDAEDGAWVSAVGNGESLTAAFGVAQRDGAQSPRLQPRRTQTRDELVAAGDLSQPPVAPNLDAVLSRHYPEQARSAGVAGRAMVRVRISSAGSVVRVTVLDESAGGFADACRHAVLGSVWSAPRDRSGRAVATEVKYVCRFRVDD